jgi:mannan endo-1,4-beta-mannosidase
MKSAFTIFLSLGILFSVQVNCMDRSYYTSGNDTIKPVNKNASPEARELLKYIYSISGKKMLTAQHENLGKMSRMTDSIYKYTGKKPAIWGGEFGFADSTHDIDNIAYRIKLVPEIIKQRKDGAIITLTYHQANPAIGEPCPFEGGVISKLNDQQWKDLLTPGTALYIKWAAQMDILAAYLKKLQDAKIPILFRPYHEMNGSWFWWGGNKNEYGTAALYRQLYHYFTDVHKLNNLIWVWTPDKPWNGLKEYFPGKEFVDILGCDIYPVKDTSVVYRKEYYQDMVNLAGNKPLALSEGCILPDDILIADQNKWAWMMAWTDMLLEYNSKDKIIRFYQSDKTITRDKLPKWLH